eukprot:scaffold105114_cov18-Tisochrysis_lutea.AAC.1
MGGDVGLNATLHGEASPEGRGQTLPSPWQRDPESIHSEQLAGEAIVAQQPVPVWCFQTMCARDLMCIPHDLVRSPGLIRDEAITAGFQLFKAKGLVPANADSDSDDVNYAEAAASLGTPIPAHFCSGLGVFDRCHHKRLSFPGRLPASAHACSIVRAWPVYRMQSSKSRLLLLLQESAVGIAQNQPCKHWLLRPVYQSMHVNQPLDGASVADTVPDTVHFLALLLFRC